MKRILITIAASFLLAACSRDVATVGGILVTQEDLAHRAKVSEIYYPGSGKPSVALSQLIKGYLSLEVLRSLGRETDNAVLEAEAKRIDESTKAPEMLAKIKAVYGGDRNGYLDTFVRVTYAERVLYGDVFLQTPAIHREQREMAEQLLRKSMADPSGLLEHARRSGMQAAMLRISREKGVEFHGKRANGPRQLGGRVGVEVVERVIPLLVGLKPGQVCPEIIEWQESFQVVRLIRREKNGCIIESASVPKRSYDDWFWQEAGKVPVVVRDKALKQELLKEVSWASRLNMK